MSWPPKLRARVRVPGVPIRDTLVNQKKGGGRAEDKEAPRISLTGVIVGVAQQRQG